MKTTHSHRIILYQSNMTVSKKIESQNSTGSANIEQWSIGDVYLNREAIAAHPEQFGRIITQFSAGGLGACSYKREVSIVHLAQCWQHIEYRHKCPECGNEAYIYFFAGHATGGGYWQIIVYCPECDCGYSIRYPQGLKHWTVLKDILKAESQNITNESSQ